MYILIYVGETHSAVVKSEKSEIFGTCQVMSPQKLKSTFKKKIDRRSKPLNAHLQSEEKNIKKILLIYINTFSSLDHTFPVHLIF